MSYYGLYIARFQWHSNAVKCGGCVSRRSSVLGEQAVRNVVISSGERDAMRCCDKSCPLARDAVRPYLHEVDVPECQTVSLVRACFFTVRTEFFNKLTILQSYQVSFQFPFLVPSAILHSHNMTRFDVYLRTSCKHHIRDFQTLFNSCECSSRLQVFSLILKHG